MVYILSLSVLLVASIYWTTQVMKRAKAEKMELEKVHKQQLATIEDVHKTQIETTSEETKVEKEWLEETYKKEIESVEKSYKNEIEILRQENEDIRRSFRNRGEFLTQLILERIKEDLINKELITPEEMIIMPNIFISDSFNKTRQLDHLVLLKTALYIIETKHWKGHIVLGINKQNTRGKFDFLPKLIGDSKDDTIVFENKGSGLTVRTYWNPINQVQQSYRVLESYLKNNSIDEVKIRTIVFFNHEEGNLIDCPENQYVKRITDKMELLKFFRDELATRNRVYTGAQLQEVKGIIERANNI